MSTQFRFGTGIALLLSLAACGRNSARNPAPGPVAPLPLATVTAPQAPRGRGAQIIVDSSQSMAGFTSIRQTLGRRTRWGSGGTVRLSTLHQQILERSLAELGANAPFRRCLLDTSLHCEDSPRSALAMDQPTTYRGFDAALDSILRRPPAGLRADTAPTDPLDPYAISILLTDGFQSAVAADAGTPEVNCAGGADPSCLGTLLANRAREGYGIWLGRIVMPFAGNYSPERPIGEMWDSIANHVTDLNTNHPEWTGVVFNAHRGSVNSASGTFRWEGARPMLMIVLSRDVSLGRRFVSMVTQRLPNEPTIFARNASADVNFSELSPFEGATARIQENAIGRAPGPTAAQVRTSPARRTPQGVQLELRCPITGQATIQVGATFARSPITPSYVDLVPSWRLKAGAGNWLRLSPRVQPGGLGADLAIDCRTLAQGVHEQTLGIFIEWRRRAEDFQTQWFIRESAETSFEAPESSYRLAQMATPAITLATDRRGWLDEITVRITRE